MSQNLRNRKLRYKQAVVLVQDPISIGSYLCRIGFYAVEDMLERSDIPRGIYGIRNRNVRVVIIELGREGLVEQCIFGRKCP